MSAILFGSISTVADTSELQRRAFNEAFEAHGLGWTWEREEYRSMLAASGGQDRVAAHAAALGQSVDAAAVHRTKSRIFQQGLREASLEPRPGVVETIRGARASGTKVGLVTTTSPQNVASVIDALRPAVSLADFDLVVDASSVETPKPDEAAYTFALAQLAERADRCVAIEDNLGGVSSAVAAGLACVAFPNENTAGHAFEQATSVVDRLDPAQLQQAVGADHQS